MGDQAMLARERRRRRLVPAPVAVALAVARGRREWSDPERREAARAAIDAIVGPVVERDALARQHLIEHAVREELIWRPWQFARAPLEGREHPTRAAAAGRGVIASLVHSGPFPAAAASLVGVTPRTCAVVGRWMRLPGPDDAMERRRLRWLANFEEAGVRTVEAPGSYPVLVEVLRAGDLVLLAYDAPGPHATTFLGRPILLGSGTARLAADTGAIVVPIWRARDRWRPYTVAGPPLDPRDHAGWQELHDALAAIHTRWIRSRPAALENPLPTRLVPAPSARHV